MVGENLRIAYIGRISVDELARCYSFDCEPVPVTCRFETGTALVKEFVRGGHHVSIITSNLPPYDLTCYHAREGLDLYVIPERPRKMSFPTLYSREIKWIHRALKLACPDVIIANWTYEYARAALTSKIPTLVVAHDSPWRIAFSMRNVATLFKAVYSQLFVFPLIRNLSTVSPHMVEDLRKYNGYRKNICLIPNAMRFPEDVPHKEIRKHATTIVCVSEWGRLKNTTALLRAFVELRSHCSDARLIMVGANQTADMAGAWMIGASLPTAGIEFRGLQKPAQVTKTLAEEADVFCSPSLEESFGMVFVEAMSQGVPCVGGVCSGAVPWLLNVGENNAGGLTTPSGVVCDVTNFRELARTLEVLMKDESLRRRLSSNGMQMARARFNVGVVARQYIRELERIRGEESAH